MKRRLKRDSATASAAVTAMIGASLPLPRIPAHVRVRDQDLPFWEGIVRARTREEWSDADLVVAAQLARCQMDIEAESLTLEGEGTVVTNDRGTLVCNPRVSVLEQLARREMALMRTLRMGGTVVGDPRHLLGQRKLQRQSESARKEIEEDELLAT